MCWVIDDIIDNLGLDLLPEIAQDTMINTLLKYSCDSDHSLRQSCIYGLGILIIRSAKLFYKYSNEILININKCIL